MKTQHFFAYDAGAVGLAIDPARPWQVVSRGSLAICGKVATEEQARAVCLALQADRDAGRLPCDLSRWEQRHLLS